MAMRASLENKSAESMQLYKNNNDGCNHVHAHLTLNMDSLFYVTSLPKLTCMLFDDGNQVLTTNFWFNI